MKKNVSLQPVLEKLLNKNKIPTIRKLLYSKFRGNRATDWGLLQEDVSRLKYFEVQKLNSLGFSISKSGLVVSFKHPWLAASPDGFVYDPDFDPLAVG